MERGGRGLDRGGVGKPSRSPPSVRDRDSDNTRPGSSKCSHLGALRPCPAMRAALTLQSLREVVKSLVDTPGFDRVYDKIKLLSAIPGKVVCEMKVEEQHTNRAGTLHGGLAATLVDVVSTVALMNTERGEPGIHISS
ncbi:acyl-coenzyme A thioesterase 13 [Alligator mississippiensis]|uniref:acyl-coenzyme A thioesterase 13 n=1 Tax=Alligator mississippiensis TaxID=8496 RepID=UPI0028777848|nr:acyl-coenzyme A thioesterase 13 [Alligator mississippiensis]